MYTFCYKQAAFVFPSKRRPARKGVSSLMLKHSLIALAALGAGLVGFSATQASAFTAPPQPVIELNENPLLTDVRHRRNYHHRGGHYRNYGYRNYGYRHHRHYRHNNYYGYPRWGLGGIGLGFGLGYYNDGYYGGYYRRGYGSGHVAWCLNRYRSYNPRTNTWVAYSGRVRQCHSPYRY
jgi:hypothetical protein